MIHGVGTDLIEIARVRAAYLRFGERFARRILGSRELERYHARRSRSDERGIAFLATRFAAKEAISKALGLGMRAPMTWRAVEIVNEASGRPIVFISSPELRQYAQARKFRLHISLSDERQFAIAHAVVEVEEGA
jgi:holo-[acyl-carrier protein] synthase